MEVPSSLSLMLLRTGGLPRGHRVYLGMKLEQAGARLAVWATHVTGSRWTPSLSPSAAQEGRLESLCSKGYLLHVAGKNILNAFHFFSLEEDLELSPYSAVFWECSLCFAHRSQVFCLNNWLQIGRGGKDLEWGLEVWLEAVTVTGWRDCVYMQTPLLEFIHTSWPTVSCGLSLVIWVLLNLF